MIYSIRGMTKIFGGRTVLDVDSLDIPKGKITALLGPNGAGKTTLLSILAFLSRPASGSLAYDSREVRFTESHMHPLRREVVLMNQHPIMFSQTVCKNMEFGLKLRKVGKEERRKIIRENLKLVGLDHFEQARAHKLSGGETQRIAIARALALSPRVILCDEPLASVDSQNQAIIVSLLRQINKERGITVIFTSHDAVWARNLAHETVYLDGGRPVDSVLENILSGNAARTEAGEVWFASGDGTRLPLPEGIEGQVRVSLDPSALKINHSSAPGQGDGLKGRVHQISREKNGIRIVVDAGALISVIMPEKEYKAMAPGIGDKVQVAIPPNAVKILNG
ncbi:ABC transporter related [Desulfatibacillum aliphaticivorans]|uniref:ABC transporter related n=2 Tax=Desulfatibacillum aliphaticivorans TaxID=218208 RepID=B8FAA6_DESAL|nr:ABC transporter related [Desulfatibacillum aliphaticivorans]